MKTKDITAKRILEEDSLFANSKNLKGLILYLAEQKEQNRITSKQFSELLAWIISSYIGNEVENHIIKTLETKINFHKMSFFERR